MRLVQAKQPRVRSQDLKTSWPHRHRAVRAPASMPLRRGTIAEATPRVHQTPRAKEFGYAVGYVPRVAAAYWVRLLGGHDDPEPAHFSSNVQPAPGDRAGSEEHR